MRDDFKEDEEEEGLMSSGDSRINRVLNRLATLNVRTVRVVAMEYSQAQKGLVCEYYCVGGPSLYIASTDAMLIREGRSSHLQQL